LAELARLLHHGRFFDCRLHIDFCFAIPRGHLSHWTRRRNNTPHPGKKCKRRVLASQSRASTTFPAPFESACGAATRSTSSIPMKTLALKPKLAFMTCSQRRSDARSAS
jgi:hypothetical protein